MPYTDEIREQALQLGFDVLGVASPGDLARAGDRFRDFLDRGWCGDMDWLERNADRRADPRVLWDDVKSVIVVGMNYGPDDDPLAALGRSDRGVVSVYARNRDYHDVMKKRLKALGRWMAATYGCALKVFVDTAPVLEKPLAQLAGIGWQGKHTNLVSRDFGSWLFLGAVYTTLDLAPSFDEKDHCGNCRACLDVCPTDAFPAPYRLDPRRCISYLTIEHKGPIPRQFRKAMGNRIYGCDDCLAVCPWNKFARVSREMSLQARDDLRAPALADLLRLDDAAFRVLFSGSPIKRLKRDRFVRNVLIAAGNSGDAALLPIIEALLEDPAPVVRGAAVWALSELLDAAAFNARKDRHLPSEADATVAAEWRDATPS
jgi:epoxyqueuosine reductase